VHANFEHNTLWTWSESESPAFRPVLMREFNGRPQRSHDVVPILSWH
jgi:hypothetical protein